MKYILIIISVIIIGVLAWVWVNSREFAIPSGRAVPLEENSDSVPAIKLQKVSTTSNMKTITSQRSISITDGVKHSIPLSEILSGGPGKDGIPSIDNPKFVSENSKDAEFLQDSDFGLGLSLGGEYRFYPYRILVWHEIINDTVGGQAILVTYCPLCATGIVFDRKVDGKEEEFGVSGKLWQSNLLMYNRASSEKNESLWSQVLGEAVLGEHTGKRLSIVRSDVVRYGDWKKAHPGTKVLSRDTGASRDYARDPYGGYYTSESVSFGATFTDKRLHPKALVHGIEVDGKYKAYSDEAIKSAKGNIEDIFAGRKIIISHTALGEIMFKADDAPLSSVPGFWFSWLAVHKETELFK